MVHGQAAQPTITECNATEDVAIFVELGWRSHT